MNGETLGLVSVSKLNSPRLSVSSRSRLKIRPQSGLCLVSLWFLNPVSSRFRLALIFRSSLVSVLPYNFSYSLVSLVSTWSLHTNGANSLNLLPNLPQFNLIYLNLPHLISIYPIYLYLVQSQSRSCLQDHLRLSLGLSLASETQGLCVSVLLTRLKGSSLGLGLVFETLIGLAYSVSSL